MVLPLEVLVREINTFNQLNLESRRRLIEQLSNRSILEGFATVMDKMVRAQMLEKRPAWAKEGEHFEVQNKRGHTPRKLVRNNPKFRGLLYESLILELGTTPDKLHPPEEFFMGPPPKSNHHLQRRELLSILYPALDRANASVIQRVREMPYLQLVYHVSGERYITLRESNTEMRWVHALARAKDPRRNALYPLLAKGEEPLPIMHITENGNLIFMPAEDWAEYCQALTEKIEAEKQAQSALVDRDTARSESATLNRQLGETQGRYDAVSASKGTLEAETKELRATAQAQEKELTRLRGIPTSEELEKRVAQLVTENEALIRTVEEEKTRGKTAEENYAEARKRVRELSDQITLGRDELSLAISALKLYEGKRIVIIGGRERQIEEIRGLLEPFGARVIYVPVKYEHTRGLSVKKADMVVEMTDTMFHNVRGLPKNGDAIPGSEHLRYSSKRCPPLSKFFTENAYRLS